MNVYAFIHPLFATYPVVPNGAPASIDSLLSISMLNYLYSQRSTP